MLAYAINRCQLKLSSASARLFIVMLAYTINRLQPNEHTYLLLCTLNKNNQIYIFYLISLHLNYYLLAFLFFFIAILAISILSNAFFAALVSASFLLLPTPKAKFLSFT